MKDLEQFLRDNKPETPDEGQFMIEMNARLNQVEGIKQTVDGENRRWRKALIITLVAGLVLGSALTALVMLHPLPALGVDESALTKAVEFLQAKREYLFIFIAACATALGVVFLSGRRQTI